MSTPYSSRHRYSSSSDPNAPLTAEREMMERIRTKLERAQRRLSRDPKLSSGLSSRQYYPSSGEESTAPAPPIQSVYLEDMPSTASNELGPPPSSRAFHRHYPPPSSNARAYRHLAADMDRQPPSSRLDKSSRPQRHAAPSQSTRQPPPSRRHHSSRTGDVYSSRRQYPPESSKYIYDSNRGIVREKRSPYDSQGPMSNMSNSPFLVYSSHRAAGPSHRGNKPPLSKKPSAETDKHRRRASSLEAKEAPPPASLVKKDKEEERPAYRRTKGTSDTFAKDGKPRRNSLANPPKSDIRPDAYAEAPLVTEEDKESKVPPKSAIQVEAFDKEPARRPSKANMFATPPKSEINVDAYNAAPVPKTPMEDHETFALEDKEEGEETVTSSQDEEVKPDKALSVEELSDDSFDLASADEEDVAGVVEQVVEAVAEEEAAEENDMEPLVESEAADTTLVDPTPEAEEEPTKEEEKIEAVEAVTEAPEPEPFVEETAPEPAVTPPPLSHNVSAQAAARAAAAQKLAANVARSHRARTPSQIASERAARRRSQPPPMAPPATTMARPSVSKPRIGVPPPPQTSGSMYAPARQSRTREPLSLRRQRRDSALPPPSLNALQGLSNGPTAFELDYRSFYEVEWRTGEFGFSFQEVYALHPSDLDDDEIDIDADRSEPQMFLRMLLNTGRATCKSFKSVHVGDILIGVGDERVSSLGLDSRKNKDGGAALSKFFRHLPERVPLILTFQRMELEDWEGGVEL